MKAKKLFHVASVLAMGLALASCGSDNKSNQNNAIGTSGFSNIQSGNAANQVNNLRGSNPCAYGQPTVQQFSTSVGGYVNGTKTFVGMQMSQTFPDIIIVQVNGSQANVQVSMCPLSNGQQVQLTGQPGFSQNFLSNVGAEGTMFFQYSVNTNNGYYGGNNIVNATSSFVGQGTY